MLQQRQGNQRAKLQYQVKELHETSQISVSSKYSLSLKFMTHNRRSSELLAGTLYFCCFVAMYSLPKQETTEWSGRVRKQPKFPSSSSHPSLFSLPDSQSAAEVHLGHYWKDRDIWECEMAFSWQLLCKSKALLSVSSNKGSARK